MSLNARGGKRFCQNLGVDRSEPLFSDDELEIEGRPSNFAQPNVNEEEPGATPMWFGTKKGTRFDQLTN